MHKERERASCRCSSCMKILQDISEQKWHSPQESWSRCWIAFWLRRSWRPLELLPVSFSLRLRPRYIKPCCFLSPPFPSCFNFEDPWQCSSLHSFVGDCYGLILLFICAVQLSKIFSCYSRFLGPILSFFSCSVETLIWCQCSMFIASMCLICATWSTLK